MKLHYFCIVCLFAMAACTTGPKDRLSSTEYFSRFNNLSEALRFYPGLLISGTGNQTKVMLRKNVSVQNQEPLYVINGFPVGTNYSSANQILNMADVTDIRLLSHPSELNTYGTMASAGVIEIRTRNTQ